MMPFLTTAKNMIKLGGYIVIFSCISAYINVIPFKNDIVPAVICGITEITNGIYMAGKINADKKLITAFIILINSFGGFSTIMQTMGMINGSGLSIRKYIYGKILCTFITGVFCIVSLNNKQFRRIQDYSPIFSENTITLNKLIYNLNITDLTLEHQHQICQLYHQQTPMPAGNLFVHCLSHHHPNYLH